MKNNVLNAVLSVMLLTFLGLPISAQSEFYVSTNAKVTCDGSIQNPFNSISAALDKVRPEKGEVVIYLREGKYILDKPIVFTSQDGNDTRQLSLKAYPGEKVVLSGGIPLSLQWEPYKKGVMKAKVNGNPVMDMLVVDGQLRHMARYPNFDETAVRFNGTSAQATAPGRVKKWKNPIGAYLHAMHNHDWGDFHYRITGKNKKGELAMEGGWQNNRQSGLHPDNRMVENVFEELDAPGEWFYAADEQILYYYPLEGEQVSEVLFESPQLKHLIEFRGTEANPVKNITLDRLELTQTLRTFMEPYERLLRSDWSIYRGAAVLFEGTEHCALRNSFLHNLGGNGIFFSNYNCYSEVTGSHLTRIGASAICFVGDPDGVRSPSFEYAEFVPYEQIDRAKGPKNNNHPAQCLVYDNLIHSIGLFEKQITGVELSMCQSITVSHNSIYDTPRAGINISEGTWGGHILEFNDIFDTVKETGDHGSFNSWGRDRYWHPSYQEMESITANNPALILADACQTTILRNNRFRCDRGWDIDLDDGSSNYHIYNNLCLNGGIKLREGYYREVENNIIINNSFHPHVWFKNSGDVFTRNIVMTEYKPINLSGWGLMVDYNIFTDSLSHAASLKNSTDEHSIVTSVQFADASAGDFTVPDDSEAITKGGFRNFAMNQFGVVSARLKAIAHTPKMPTLVVRSGCDSSDVIVWSGATIKNLQTLGERSATGMDSERGVYIISVSALDSKLRDYLRPNDVIVKVGKSPVNNLKEMFDLLGKTDKTKDVELVIFRTQKENKVVIPGRLLD